jgi:hypothetical protein
MKRLIIHIGDYKAGSTSIQNFLFANQTALIEQGIGYPGDHQKLYFQDRQHVPLAAALTGKNLAWLHDHKRPQEPAAVVDQFKSDAAACGTETILISSESFFGICTDPHQIKRILKPLSDYTVQVIVYLRRHDEELMSGFQQQCKRGRSRQIRPNDLFHNRRPGYYRKRLDAWVQAIGQHNVTVRPFESEQWTNHDLCADLLATLKISETAAFIAQPPANASVALEKMQALRLFNKWIKRQGQDPRARYWQRLRRRIIANDQILKGGNAKSVLSPALRRRVIGRFASETDYIGQRFSGRHDGRLFIRAAPDDVAWQPPMPLSVTALSDAINTIAENNREDLRLLRTDHVMATQSIDLPEFRADQGQAGDLDQLFPQLHDQLACAVRIKALKQQLRRRKLGRPAPPLSIEKPAPGWRSPLWKLSGFLGR